METKFYRDELAYNTYISESSSIVLLSENILVSVQNELEGDLRVIVINDLVFDYE
jgi:hypothetical protein